MEFVGFEEPDLKTVEIAKVERDLELVELAELVFVGIVVHDLELVEFAELVFVGTVEKRVKLVELVVYIVDRKR